MTIEIACGAHLAAYTDGRDDPACVRICLATSFANVTPDIAEAFGQSLIATACAARSSNDARRRALIASTAAQTKVKEENARHQ